MHTELNPHSSVYHLNGCTIKNNMQLLIIEDSERLRRSLVVGLSNLGFTVDEASDGLVGLNIAENNHYDLIILDIMLPNIDGLTLLKKLRRTNNYVKILILSAKNQPNDRIKGLLDGADDYLSKPFVFDELHARILALLRRDHHFTLNNSIRLDNFCLDLHQKRFSYQNEEITLTVSEYKIIETLFSKIDHLVTIDCLISAIAGNFDYVSKNTIYVHISSIRKKIRSHEGELPLKQKRGLGYILMRKTNGE